MQKNSYEMNEENCDYAKKCFCNWGQEFDATLILENDKFFIMDWRDKNGSGNLATRYIVDKKKGNLIITGDAGDCIASWYNSNTPDQIAGYLNDLRYFISKIQCSTNKYTYEWDDIRSDLNEIKQEYLELLEEDDLDIKGEDGEPIEEDEIDDDFEEMEYELTYRMDQEFDGDNFPNGAVKLFEKYDSEWYDSRFACVGERPDHRLYLWAYGFQTGVKRIREREKSERKEKEIC